MKVKITNIHESMRRPDIIYAELREVKTNNLLIAATLGYIFEVLKKDGKNRGYEVVNVAMDAYGNCCII